MTTEAQTRTTRLPASLRDRELLVFAPLYAWLSFIDYSVKLGKAREWYSVLPGKHQKLLNFDHPNNEQSRLLQFYVPEAFHRVLGTTIPHSYVLARLLFVFLAFVCFHYFLRRWFSPGEALAGVALLAAMMGFSHTNDLQESAPLLMLLFIAALYAIRDNRMLLLLGVLSVGGLTNETMLVLPVVYFFYHVRFTSLRRVLLAVGRAIVVAVPLLITIGPIRYLTRNRPQLGGAYNWPGNLRGIRREITDNPLDWPHDRYLFFILIFGVLGIYAFLRYSDKPRFLRRRVVDHTVVHRRPSHHRQDQGAPPDDPALLHHHPDGHVLRLEAAGLRASRANLMDRGSPAEGRRSPARRVDAADPSHHRVPAFRYGHLVITQSYRNPALFA